MDLDAEGAAEVPDADQLLPLHRKFHPSSFVTPADTLRRSSRSFYIIYRLVTHHFPLRIDESTSTQFPRRNISLPPTQRRFYRSPLPLLTVLSLFTNHSSRYSSSSRRGRKRILPRQSRHHRFILQRQITRYNRSPRSYGSAYSYAGRIC